MSRINKFILALVVTLPIATLAAGEPVPSAFVKTNTVDKTEVVKAFRYYKNVSPVISKTSVVEVPFSQESFSIPTFAVYNITTGEFEPSILSVLSQETKFSISTGSTGIDTGLLSDGNYGTYLEFPLTSNSNRIGLFFSFQKPITASSLSITLDNYVALPQTISISTSGSSRSGEKIVLAPVRPIGTNIVFPQTTSAFWSVYFDYVQPLRISEIKFNDESNKVTTRGLRFLAQPGQSYQIYFDADRYVTASTKEAGNLFSSTGVVHVGTVAAVANPEYKPVDSDNDSVPDLRDNCISVANSDQKDEDSNGRGDACEDDDRDGVLNFSDNCIDTPNGAQTDTDADGIGDICDTRDNRATERMPWLPWAGLGLAGAVVLGLFVMVLKHKKEDVPPPTATL